MIVIFVDFTHSLKEMLLRQPSTSKDDAFEITILDLLKQNINF